MLRVIAGTLLAVAVAWGASAEPARPDQRILFTPAPLGGAGTGGFERESSLQPQSGAITAPAIPAPKPRPVIHPATNAASPPRANLPKVDFGALGGSSRTSLLAAPQPQALDLSRGVDLGGVSLGLATSRDNGSGSGGTGLVTLDTKTPIPVDPALATRQGAIPYLGLSLSAPTN